MKTTEQANPEKKEFSLSESEKETLLDLARKTIEEKIRLGKKWQPDTSGFSGNLESQCGAFVTLHHKGNLRGCIGRMIGDLPLYQLIQEMAISSALHDPRFYPVRADELEDIDIELSVLSPLQKIDNVSEIELGKHGILIVKGPHSGVFLPQVATETNWSLEEYLGHCSRDKAGLDWDGWKTADIFIFSALVFGEKQAPE